MVNPEHRDGSPEQSETPVTPFDFRSHGSLRPWRRDTPDRVGRRIEAPPTPQTTQQA